MKHLIEKKRKELKSSKLFPNPIKKFNIPIFFQFQLTISNHY